MRSVLQDRFAEPDGYARLVDGLFKDMFTARSDKAVAASVAKRASRLPQSIGKKMLLDMLQYDTECLPKSLARLRMPVMALQTTYSNEKRERATMTVGQTTPYLNMLRTHVPSIRIEIIADTGHFPQLDESMQTNALIDDFLKMPS